MYTVDTLRDDLISDSILFLRSICQYYGSEKGMEAWTTISKVLGDDIRSEIFINMLTGGNFVIQISRSPDSAPNAIAVIKLIRQATGLGLKEAKDIWEKTNYGVAKLKLSLSINRSELISELQARGMIVK